MSYRFSYSKPLRLDLDVIVAQDGAGDKQVFSAHHQPPRQYTHRSFKGAHMDVHLEHPYIFALKECFGKGNYRWVVTAQKLSHGTT